MERRASERAIVFLVAAVQFVVVLEFYVVMPMGPDVVRALGIPASQIGLIGGVYTLAAAAAGLLGSFVLDRYGRRKALAVAMLGLVVGTTVSGLAQGLPSLLLGRVLAGMFGGPATSVSVSIIADVVPPERRGQAMGTVRAAFSVASVLGVPVALKASEWFDWRMPFLGIASLGLLGSLSAIFLLPSLTGHLEAAQAQGRRGETLRALAGRPVAWLSYLMAAAVTMAGFLVIPNVSAYAQGNLRYPREDLGTLYFIAGIASFFTLRWGGRLVDRVGSFWISVVGSALLTAVLCLGFVRDPPGLPVLGIFIGFWVAMALRSISYNTLMTKVPGPAERARYMSVQSTVQHLASAAGAGASSRMLAEGPGRVLVGMDGAALLAVGVNLLFPPLAWLIERRVSRGER